MSARLRATVLPDLVMDEAGKEVIGVEFLPDYPEVRFVDGTHPRALLHQRLMAAFPDRHVRVTSFTEDTRTAVVATYDDREPPVYYLLDTEAFTARFLLASRPWIRAEQMAPPREAFWINARDGARLQGYLTRPLGSDDTDRLPMVVVVHGGPHGPRDTWAFDYEAQLLANRGYLVLQINQNTLKNFSALLPIHHFAPSKKHINFNFIFFF